MSKVLVTESHLGDIADAIRAKNGSADTYRPGDMPAAIAAIPNSYAAGDEGKVVSNGELVTQIARAAEISENGQYDTTYNNSVTVNISSGGIPILTRSAWDALTTAQKQAYETVGIQDYSSGYKRGELVYGADYGKVGLYLPESDAEKVICEAYYDNFVSGESTWGFGDTPVTIMSGLNPSKSVPENAIYIPAGTNSPQCAYVDLGASGTPFTVYVVMKLVNPSTYSRIVCAVNSRSAGQGMLMFGPSIVIASWANDTNTGISSTSYFAAALQFAGSGSAFGLVHGGSVVTKPPTTAGRYITIARTDPGTDGVNADPINAYVRYMGVVKEAETQSVVALNLANLASRFI